MPSSLSADFLEPLLPSTPIHCKTTPCVTTSKPARPPPAQLALLQPPASGRGRGGCGSATVVAQRRALRGARIPSSLLVLSSPALRQPHPLRGGRNGRAFPSPFGRFHAKKICGVRATRQSGQIGPPRRSRRFMGRGASSAFALCSAAQFGTDR